MSRRARVMASGGEVGRLSIVGGAEVGFSFFWALVKEIEKEKLKQYVLDS